MKYIISGDAGGYYAEDPDVTEYDPRNAAIAWCRMGEKHRTCASVMADTEEAAYALITWAYENFDELRVYMEEHKCPYKPEWMYKVIESQVEKGHSSLQWEFDQVEPFSFG